MRELSENLGPGGDHQVDKWTSGDWFPRNEIDLSWSQPAVVGLQSANGWFAKSCLTKDEGLSLLIKKIFSLLITVQSIFSLLRGTYSTVWRVSFPHSFQLFFIRGDKKR